MEHTEQLKTYIQQQLRNGLTSDEIAAQLKHVGWADDAVQQAFQAVQAAVMPSVLQVSTPSAAEPQNTAATVTSSAAPVFAATAKRWGRLRTAWLLLKQSVRVLRVNKSLIRYPLMNIVFMIPLVIILFMIFVSGHNIVFGPDHISASGAHQINLRPIAYLIIFIFYIIAYFINNFYGAGLAANVLDLFGGKKQPYASYIAKARSRAGTIFFFAVIEATVGMILRYIAERSRLLARIVARILGAIWGLATLFVDPLIISSDVSAPQAIKRSVKLFKDTWGENVIGRVTLGVAGFFISCAVIIAGTILIILGGAIGGPALVFIIALLCCIAYLLVGVVISAANSILNTALFYFAEYKQVPAAFDADLLNALFIPRKKRRFFHRAKP